jgi:hypothetical protein
MLVQVRCFPNICCVEWEELHLLQPGTRRQLCCTGGFRAWLPPYDQLHSGSRGESGTTAPVLSAWIGMMHVPAAAGSVY